MAQQSAQRSLKFLGAQNAPGLLPNALQMWSLPLEQANTVGK
jgi:hypothetical protein